MRKIKRLTNCEVYYSPSKKTPTQTKPTPLLSMHSQITAVPLTADGCCGVPERAFQEDLVQVSNKQ